MKKTDILDLPRVKRRRQASANEGLAISLILSVLASVILHFAILLGLGKMQFEAPLFMQKHEPKQVKEELDWFLVTPLDPKEEESRALARGLRSVHERRGFVSDQELEQEELQRPEDILPEPKTEELDLDIPTPELSDAALDAAFKTVKLTGVEVEKADLSKPDILSATLPEATELMTDADEFLAVPDVQAAAAPKTVPAPEVPELKGAPQMMETPRLGSNAGGLSPIAVPETGRGSSWAIPAGNGLGDVLGGTGDGHAGVSEGVEDGVGVRGGLDGKTGYAAGIGGGVSGGVPGGVGTRPTAVLGVKVRLGTGLSFEVPGKTQEEEVEDPVLEPDDQLLSQVRLREGGEAVEKSIPLDDFVTVSMTVTPDESGGGYYEVKVMPNEKCDSLSDVAKDVLFIIDHSGSIRGVRLSQFKEMTRQALSYLNANDRFNVVSFTSNSRTFFKDFVSPTKANLAEAYRRLGSLMSHGQTDVFGGVGPYVKRSNGEKDRPLIVFVMSDGQSTVGVHKGEVMVNNRKVTEVLRAVALSNPGNVSVYPFSAGDDIDRVLMDFLARLNRGVPMHVKDGGNFRRELSVYLRSHMSLLVRNFRYIAEGGLDDRLYPRHLPHLYRNEPLSIYGRYESGEEELVLTLLGYDYQGKLRNLVFKRRFEDCEGYAEGGGALSVSLREQWTAQKALHLLAEWVVSEESGKKYSGARMKKRQELNRLLGTIRAFSKYSGLLGNQ